MVRVKLGSEINHKNLSQSYDSHTIFYQYLLHLDQLKEFFSKFCYINRPHRSRLTVNFIYLSFFILKNLNILSNKNNYHKFVITPLGTMSNLGLFYMELKPSKPLVLDPYKRTLNRSKFSKAVTVFALAEHLCSGRSVVRSAWRSFPYFCVL
ncbi:hypothetical protein BpHYR1_040378 [Brachionus plicatilis]|uniref:Uncharacterized protein n=1 Tax=Brachionus plicatilis TaxID=10195 RepID=A0A3M7QYS1_BRAPC|nr:hypothetical protein BpHYR1_040378 [Brachionus plicatilis]